MSFPARYAIAPQPQRQHRDADQTRTKALQAAAAQIAAVGFNKTTIASVAAHAGVSQSGLLHHFPSKAALLAAVLDAREQEDSDFLFGNGEPPMSWDAFESLIALTARNTSRPEWVALFVRTAAEATVATHPANDWVTRHYRSLRTWLRDAITAGIARGEFLPDTPVDTLASSTIAVLDGAQQQWILEPDSVSMLDIVRAHITALRHTWGTIST